jgi:ABC-type proline/glycine betaine transport system substrate-binding protein
MDEEMMINDTKYRLLSILLITPIFLPTLGGGSVLPLSAIENAVQGYFSPNSATSEPIDTRDPNLVVIIDTIERCECAKTPDNECISDHQNMDSGSWSYGSMQWKLRTFEGALKDLKLYTGQTDDEMRAMMKDRATSKDIAYKWTEKSPEHLHDWTCYKGE